MGVRSEGWMDGGSGLLGALSMMSVTALCTYKKEKKKENIRNATNKH